jgi:protocatechuate 3,4-dioxygenase beta subunit
MGTRRFVLLAVLLALVGAGLFALWKAVGESTTDATRATELTTDGTREATRASSLEAPSTAHESERAPTKVQASTPAAPDSDRTENFKLDGALWIEGSVRVPSGAPPDDSLCVWTVTARDVQSLKWIESTLDSVSLVENVRNAAEFDSRWARRPVDAQSRFRVPCPGDATSAYLVVEGRYLFTAQPKPIQKSKLSEPVVLEPELGAWLVVRCVPPPGASAEQTAAGGHATLFGFSTGSSSGKNRGSVHRELDIADDSMLDLRALPPEVQYTLAVAPKQLANATKSPIPVTAGKKTELDLPLKYGARVSGRVVDEQRAPVAGVKIMSSANGGGMFSFKSSPERSATSASDGSFELAGLNTGTQHLTASLEGWADGDSGEIALKEDQHVTDVVITLPRGSSIRGTVKWPDGTPAKNASVQAIDTSDKRPGARYSRKVRGAKTDEQGQFAIGGLGSGPFLVGANARKLEIARADSTGSATKAVDAAAPGSKSQTASASKSGDESPDDDGDDTPSTPGAKKATLWIATQLDVRGDTTDLALVLRAPPGLAGRVVDPSGTPVRAFKVNVTPDWRSRELSLGRDAYEQSFASDDGSFTVDGVTDGEWKVDVKSDAFMQSGEPPSVRVPQTGDPLVIKMVVAATVSGTVVDPAGTPVVGAQVQRRVKGDRSMTFFMGGDPMSATTDDKGAFALKSVPAGSWQLVASSDGWAKSDPTSVQVVSGQNVDGVALHLRAGGTLVGEVWDARGSHAVGRNVQLFSMMSGDSRQIAVDDGGSFKAEHLTPGTYQVVLEPDEEQKAKIAERPGNGDEGDVADLLSSMKISSCDIKDGEVTHIVLGAPPKSPVKLTGRITQAGAPVSKCTLVVMNEGGSVLQSLKFGKVDASGRYELTIDKPGDVVLVVTKDLGKSKGVDFYLTVPEVPEYAFDLELPVCAIRGTVRGPDGAPIANTTVQLMRDTSGVSIMTMDGPRSEATDSNGRYAFDDLAVGTYAVAAGGSSGMFGEESSYGRVVRGGLHVEKDRVLDPIDLKLTGSGKITGTVRDTNGDPVAGASVFVRDAQGELLARMSACTSDETGEYTYKGLAPGNYTVSARAGTRAARDSASTSVHEGESAHVDLTLEPGTILRVSAVDKSDKPLKAGISVKDEHGFELASMQSMDAMQDFLSGGVSSTEQKFGPLPSGKYVVTATTFDGKSAKKPVTLKDQDERKVVVRIE